MSRTSRLSVHFLRTILAALISVLPLHGEWLGQKGPERVGVIGLVSNPSDYTDGMLAVEGVCQFVSGESYLFPSREFFERGLISSSVRLEFVNKDMVLKDGVDYLFLGRFMPKDGKNKVGLLKVESIEPNPHSFGVRKKALIKKLYQTQVRIADGEDVSKAELLLTIMSAIELLEIVE